MMTPNMVLNQCGSRPCNPIKTGVAGTEGKIIIEMGAHHHAKRQDDISGLILTNGSRL